MLRWVATTGEKGPPALDGPPRTKSAVAQRRGLTACEGWSETASTTNGVWQNGGRCPPYGTDACAIWRFVGNEAGTHDISLQLSVLRRPRG